jgi:hypothetical protein
MGHIEVPRDVLSGYHLATNGPALLKNTLYTNSYNTIKWIEKPLLSERRQRLGNIGFVWAVSKC